jgi:flagellar basal body L-ring protein FlgH
MKPTSMIFVIVLCVFVLAVMSSCGKSSHVIDRRATVPVVTPEPPEQQEEEEQPQQQEEQPQQQQQKPFIFIAKKSGEK